MTLKKKILKRILLIKNQSHIELRLDINLNNVVGKLCAAMINEGRGAKVLDTYIHSTYIHTYIHTDIQTL